MAIPVFFKDQPSCCVNYESQWGKLKTWAFFFQQGQEIIKSVNLQDHILIISIFSVACQCLARTDNQCILIQSNRGSVASLALLSFDKEHSIQGRSFISRQL